jgi:3-methylcrotonyl-CoA carboxylase alpha subunit
MAQMASKSDSKNIMESAKNKVPVTPGYHGENQESDFL